MPATEFVAGIFFCPPDGGRFALDGVEDGAAQAGQEQGLEEPQEQTGQEPEVNAPQVEGAEDYRVCLVNSFWAEWSSIFEQFAHLECAAFLSTYPSCMSALRTR